MIGIDPPIPSLREFRLVPGVLDLLAAQAACFSGELLHAQLGAQEDDPEAQQPFGCDLEPWLERCRPNRRPINY